MSSKRIYQETYPYFVTINSISHRQEILEVNEYCLLFANLLLENANKYKCHIYAFCFMPNHIHLLIKTNKELNISKFIQKFKSLSYFQMKNKFNFRHKFWQPSFHSLVKDSELSIETALKYIINNPRKIELSDKYSKWPYLFINKD